MLLKVGSRGPMVRHHQHQLKMLGYYTGAVDGIFGQGTRAAVVKFQSEHGLQADGRLGPATMTVLNRVAGHHHMHGMMR